VSSCSFHLIRRLSRPGNSPPAGWERDGTLPSMAKIVTWDKPPRKKALAILTEDAESRGMAQQHRAVRAAGRRATTGRMNGIHHRHGRYIGGKLPEAAEATIIFPRRRCGYFRSDGPILPSFVRAGRAILAERAWFWTLFRLFHRRSHPGNRRLPAWHPKRLELLAGFRESAALEQERGQSRATSTMILARVTEISLASALAKTKASFPNQPAPISTTFPN